MRTYRISIIILALLVLPLTACQTTLSESFEKHVDPVLYSAKSFFAGEDDQDDKKTGLYANSAYAPSTMFGISHAMTNGSVEVYDIGYNAASMEEQDAAMETMYGVQRTYEDRTISVEPGVTVYALDTSDLDEQRMDHGQSLTRTGAQENRALNLIPPAQARTDFPSPFDERGRLKETPPHDVPAEALMTMPSGY